MTREAKLAAALILVCWAVLIAYQIGKLGAPPARYYGNGDDARMIEGTYKVLVADEVPVSS